MDHVRYDYSFPKLGRGREPPRFGLDHNRCILCTRCVRVCWHIEGAGTKNVAGRGAKSVIIDDLEPALGRVGDLHLVRQVRHGLPDRAPSSTRARRSAEMERDRVKARIHRQRPGEKAMDRLRIATVWLGGCSGCHMSFLDLDEFLIDLAGMVDLVYSPVIDVKEYPEGVDVCLVEGAVCNQDNLELLLHRSAERTKVLVSFGDCAVTGNVPAIRNQLGAGNAENVLQCAYIDNAQDNPRLPQADGHRPGAPRARAPLHEVVAGGGLPARLPAVRPHRIRALLERVLAGLPLQLEGEQLRFG